MSCVACSAQDTPGLVALTPNVHERLCEVCTEDWTAHSSRTMVHRNNNAAVLAAFRRWCEARRKEAA
jgi:hypothetical protein